VEELFDFAFRLRLACLRNEATSPLVPSGADACHRFASEAALS
jgi:hypothetical protein